MGDVEGVQLLVLLFVLSVLSGLIALAVSPDLRADLWAQVRRPLAWLAGAARALRVSGRSLPAASGFGRATNGLPDDPRSAAPPPRMFVLERPRAEPLPWMRAGSHPLPVYGVAADQPPSGLAVLLRQLAWFDLRDGADPFRFPIGWTVCRQPAGALRLEIGTFRRGPTHAVVNILISGQIGCGKDVLLRSILLALLHRTSPDELRVAILDGKGLDYVGYAGLAHLAVLANDIPDIPPALTWLDEEREQRKTLLREVGAKNWADAPTPKPFPLLLVCISELTTLERFIDSFWEWANDHLSLDRALGICYIVGTQTASNTPTRWRRQVQLCIAGYQPSPDDDRPNTNLSAGRWPEDTIPPSGLPLGGGYFAVVLGRTALNVRAAFIPDAEEAEALATIRERWGAVAVPVRPHGAPPESPSESPADAPPVVPAGASADAGTADTTAVRAGSDVGSGDVPVRGAAPALMAAEPRSRAELIALLARQRTEDGTDWGYSANKIAELVGGTRAVVLEQIRAARGTVDGPQSGS
jgi:hypothetical protein